MTYAPDKLCIYPDTTILFQSVARQICDYAHECVQARGLFTLALAGGSTPASLYALLSQSPYLEQMPWRQTHFYFGDERFVPHDHADSNYAMAKRTLFDHVPVAGDQIHPVPTDCATAADCAGQYAALLASTPSLDLVLLGMGDDGHTASLFPATDILEVKHSRAAAVYLADKDSWRISMTYPQLNDAKRIMVLITGKQKSERVRSILKPDDSNKLYPVMALRPLGQLSWHLDADAHPA